MQRSAHRYQVDATRRGVAGGGILCFVVVPGTPRENEIKKQKYHWCNADSKTTLRRKTNQSTIWAKGQNQINIYIYIYP